MWTKDILEADSVYAEKDLLSDSDIAVNVLKAMQRFLQILETDQDICENIRAKTQSLCQEIQSLTKGYAYLVLHRRNQATKKHLQPNTHSRFTVQFCNRSYGTLYILADTRQKDQPALSPKMAQMISRLCGWLLHSLELSAFISAQGKYLDYHVFGRLTKREQEILLLMCQGYKQEMIAEMLHITPATVAKHRQHVYLQLGVHSEQDALLAAYYTDLFSIVEQ